MGRLLSRSAAVPFYIWAEELDRGSELLQRHVHGPGDHGHLRCQDDPEQDGRREPDGLHEWCKLFCVFDQILQTALFIDLCSFEIFQVNVLLNSFRTFDWQKLMWFLVSSSAHIYLHEVCKVDESYSDWMEVWTPIHPLIVSTSPDNANLLSECSLSSWEPAAADTIRTFSLYLCEPDVSFWDRSAADISDVKFF